MTISREPEVREYAILAPHTGTKCGFISYRPATDKWMISLHQPISSAVMKELIETVLNELAFNESVQDVNG